MKRIITILLILAFSSAVYAKKVTRRTYKTENETKEEITENNNNKNVLFDFEFSGLVYGLSGMQGEYRYDGSHIRLNPGFAMSNNDMKAVFSLEIDQNFGRGTQPHDAGPGTQTHAVEIKHAYLETSESLLNGLIIMAGLNSYSFPVVVNNDFALIQASYDFSFCKPVLSLIAIDEYSEVEQTSTGTDQDSDLRAYAVDIPFKYEGFGMRLGAMYIVGGGSSTTASDGRLTSIGVNIKGDVGFAVLNASGGYLIGRLNSTVKASAYALDSSLEIKPVSVIKLGGFITFGSGDDGSDPEKYHAYFNTMNSLFGDTTTKTGAPDGRLFLLENATVANSLSGAPASVFDYMDDPLGYFSYGGYAEAYIGNFSILARFGMAYLVEKDINGKNFIGSEVDLKLSYGIVPSTSVFIEAAGIKAGDILTDNVYQGMLGMTTKF